MLVMGCQSKSSFTLQNPLLYTTCTGYSILMNPVDAKWCGAFTDVHLFASSGNAKKISGLLTSQNHLVNSVAIDNVTPLHLACSSGHRDCAEILIGYGANVNARNIENSTPLNEAAARGFASIVELLIKSGAETNPVFSLTSPLHDAAMGGHIECIDLLVRNGADLEVHDCHYGTPLFITCFKHHFECVKYLLNFANVNAKKTHSTPLHYAALGYTNNNTEAIIRLLLAAGANPYKQDNRGRRAKDCLLENSSEAALLTTYARNPRTLRQHAIITVRKALFNVTKGVPKLKKLPKCIVEQINLDILP